ncbi:MAG: SocA family protein [Candidatus Aenigmarchaeota archaeon]|nr:SocA family protein [Candidatus Aenigmarchaeota archaeon]
MTKFSEKKFTQVLHYIIHKCGAKENVGKMVLYKLLYFTDFDFYELNETPLTGETYTKIKYGPAPSHFDSAIKSLKGNRKIQEFRTRYGYPQNKYISLENPDISLLSGEEVELINNVVEKLSNMVATQISEFSHKDMPFIATKEGKRIDYELVFYRDSITSVRKYEDGK